MRYAHLFTTTNFTFLTGASHPPEYIYRAAELGYDALAITDECSLAGVVKAFVAAEELNFKLIIGSRFTLSNGMQLIAIAPTRKAYAELSGFITLARMRSEKGEYEAHFDDLRFRLQHCLIIWIGYSGKDVIDPEQIVDELHSAFKHRLWIGINHQLHGDEQEHFQLWLTLGYKKNIPLVACGEALMHAKDRKPLQDILSAIRENTPVADMGTRLQRNAEAYLKSLNQLAQLYPGPLLEETSVIADMCHFSMTELRYQYPQELVPEGITPIAHLRNLVNQGKLLRWPTGVLPDVENILEKEMELIEELNYEFYFLTVHDIVRFARSQNILCQGRGSAANSVVCYCLFITEIAPGQIQVLFERFISRERDEPPDIDVDFEHQRREEVIQYIYRKYGRERAAIAATVICYRSKSSVRDVGKALGMELSLIDRLAKSITWWDEKDSLDKRVEAEGLHVEQQLLQHFFKFVEQIDGFPRHLSQHTGGFVIAQDKLSNIVPLENASMPDRTIIQWDKDDLEAMHLLKVDVLALGMLTALGKAFLYVSRYDPIIKSMSDLPREDKATYEMICRADTVGVFQIESRAQMTMLPRLQPRCFYDLIVEIAIVRPGPILGDMVHPYLRRRAGLEPVTFPSEQIKDVLSRTLGVPIFQEQVMRLSMVAAGFTGGEADELRRAITNWGKNSKLLTFKDKFINGFLASGYTPDFAERTFEQVKGFGGYGFPESHSASFALLAYASSWLKCHHPAAFYCAILNSQPMGFYQPSALIRDARRHGVKVLPVDINQSLYENHLEKVKHKNGNELWGIRLGFCEVNGLDSVKAQAIETWRGNESFTSIEDVARRSLLTANDLQCLASADVLRVLSGNRHKARWDAAAVEPYLELLADTKNDQHDLLTLPPTIEKDVLDDYQTLGYSLRAHPLALLRNEVPFNTCTRKCDLLNMRHKGFIKVAGLVMCKQRPGTAKGTMFVTLEDESGEINVVIWSRTQETFRNILLTSKLLVVKGTLEIVTENSTVPVIHVVAGHLQDYSYRLDELAIKTRNFR